MLKRPPVSERRVWRWGRAGEPGGAEAGDALAVEEPLEIRVANDPLSITMRTPGHDRELAAGFLFAEGLIASRDDLGGLVHCGRPGTPEYGNAIDVQSAPGFVIDVERTSATRRGTLTTSACGVCGRTSIDDVRARCRTLSDGPRLEAAALSRAVASLSSAQPTFQRTGGLHAAAICDAAGTPLCTFEDVGRHNAVDKAVGALLLAGLLPHAGEGGPAILAVSGRSSFEIVQKAAAAGLRVVASVSAASSLAAELADACNLTLAGFVRGGALTVYTHPERLT